MIAGLKRLRFSGSVDLIGNELKLNDLKFNLIGMILNVIVLFFFLS